MKKKSKETYSDVALDGIAELLSPLKILLPAIIIFGITGVGFVIWMIFKLVAWLMS